VPRPHIAMRKIRDVLRLRAEGFSLRQLSAAIQVPHTTAADYLRRAAAAGVSWPLPEGLDDEVLETLLFGSVATGEDRSGRAAPDFPAVHLELRKERKRGVTLMLLWHEYKETHPTGYGYSQFAELYRRWRRHLDVVMRFEHKAGEKLFVDFPGQTLPIYDPKTGEIHTRAELFVAVLGASSYIYAELFASQELLYWVTGHVNCFEHLGGCPAIVVPDNLRAGVTRPHRYEPTVNATFLEMASHYDVAIIPARAYKPRDKAKAEAGVLMAERWILARLRKERFTSIAQANVAVKALCASLNRRPFKKLPGSRQELFETLDRPALRPLPATRYDFATWRTHKVAIDYHVEIRAERHYYSVPYRLVGERVDVRLSAASVEVFFKSRRVASHLRAHRPGYTTDPAHMPDSHRRHAHWTPERMSAWAHKSGPSVSELASEILSRRPHPEQGYRSVLGIIRLGERFGTERLEAACGRALFARSYSYRSVESILKKGLDAQPLPEPAPDLTHPDHENLRGPDYYR
jgi:transposase